MNLDNLNLVELNLEDKMNISGGSWLSRQWDSLKQFAANTVAELEQKYYEYLQKEKNSDY